MRFNEEKYRKSGDRASQNLSNYTFAMFLGYDFINNSIVKFMYDEDVISVLMISIYPCLFK